MEKLIEKLKNEIHPHKLIYLSEFGSSLYGTNSENSDIDYKGIFLPNKRELLLGKKMKSYTYSSGNDKGKNTKDDVDIQLWSLHYFIELLSKGETGAIDLLFSMNSDKIIYGKTIANYIYKNRNNFFDPKNTKAYLGYAIGQAKKYSIKGSRTGVIKDIKFFLDSLPISFDATEFKLSNFIDEIIHKFFDKSYCFSKKINNINSLVLCGRVHQETISMKEFKMRIDRDWDKYGDRAKLAMENKGIDRKAISHACRCCIQMIELLKTGNIIFPLQEKDLIKSIKYGNHTWDELEKLILFYLEKVYKEIDDCKLKNWKYDNKFVEDFILSFY
jgi:hypothetical protein